MKHFNRIFICTGSLILFCLTGFSQIGKITLSHNGVTSFFTTLASAHSAAVNNDTVYLPGGSLAGTTISKKLTIFGAGFCPDSTLATMPTTLSSKILIANGASGGKIEGISGEIYFNNNTNSSFTLKRCYLVLNCENNASYSHGANMLISDCIITEINDYLNFPSVTFEKNIFALNRTYKKIATFTNNIFHHLDYPMVISNSFLNNNIFIGTTTTINMAAITSCTLANNLFCSTAGSQTVINWGTSNTFINNLTNQSTVNNLISISGNTFSYSNNYHLKPTSPGINYGTDQTDVGIYGTARPCKAGWVPLNPHISSKNIGLQVGSSGNLSIDVTAVGQSR